MFAKNSSLKICFDLKSRQQLLSGSRIKLEQPIADPIGAAWMIDPEHPLRTLEKLAQAYLPNFDVDVETSMHGPAEERAAVEVKQLIRFMMCICFYVC